MKADFMELLRKVQQLRDDECATKAAALLMDAEARFVEGIPTHEDVGTLLLTLKTRLKISAHTGKRIFGINQLIAQLAELDDSVTVVGSGVVSPRAAGMIYLKGENRQILGAVIVDLDR